MQSWIGIACQKQFLSSHHLMDWSIISSFVFIPFTWFVWYIAFPLAVLRSIPCTQLCIYNFWLPQMVDHDCTARVVTTTIQGANTVCKGVLGLLSLLHSPALGEFSGYTSATSKPVPKPLKMEAKNYLINTKKIVVSSTSTLWPCNTNTHTCEDLMPPLPVRHLLARYPCPS